MEYGIAVIMINGHYIQITLKSKLKINNPSATGWFKITSTQSVFSFHSVALKFIYHYNIVIDKIK